MTAKLKRIIKQIDLLWMELLSLHFELSAEKDPQGDPLFKAKKISARTKRRVAELERRVYQIIADNKELLLRELSEEIKLIVQYEGVGNLPPHITRRRDLRFSVANWVLKSLH